LQEVQQDQKIYLGDYILIFKRRWKLIFITFIIILGLTFIYLVRAPKQYEASAIIKLKPSRGTDFGSAISAFFPIGQSIDVATEIETIKGREIAEKVIKDLNLDKKEENLNLKWNLLVMKFRNNLMVEQENKTSMIRITAISNSPSEAKDIANKVAFEYIQMTENSNRKVWENLINQMGIKLKEVETELEKSRQLLHQYEAKEGITTGFSSLLIGGGASKEGYGSQYAIPEVPQAIAALKTNIMQMEIQLDGLRKYLPEKNPEVVRLKTQIENSKQRLQQEQEKAIEKYNKQFGLTDLAAKVLFNQQLYTTLASKHEDLKAQYIIQNKPPEIVELAQEPDFPSKPRKAIILMAGAFLGLFLGLGLVFFLEFINSPVRIPRDVERSIGLPVIGKIPRIRAKKDSTTKNSPLFIIYNNPTKRSWIREFYKESFRVLQSWLMHSFISSNNDENKDFRGKILMVTSSLPKEGKSVIGVNLAISMAQIGKKVLLMDIDSYNSSKYLLSGLLKGEQSIGLIDILNGKANWNDVVIESSVNNLYVIPLGEDGSSDLSALLISPKFDDLIKSLRDNFDLIIIKSAPVTLSSQSLSIGAKVDGVILIAKADHTKKDVVLHSTSLLQGSGANILGVVLNQMNKSVAKSI